jgi:uncharacterized protein (DUF1810 family)
MSTGQDPFHLQRFVEAQATCYGRVLDELRRGRKRSHWMWFIFPQIRGLGHSVTAQTYAIASHDEARAYLAHAVLGPRLVECTGVVNALDGKSLGQIFGTPDDLKFCSSMTLFARAAPGILAEPDTDVFQAALDRYCGGRQDPLTLERSGVAADITDVTAAHPTIQRRLDRTNGHAR